MCVATMLRLKLQRTRIQNTQFVVHVSDIPVTLKQSQGHKTYNDIVDSRQGYNHTKFQRSCLNGVREKGNVLSLFLFSKRGNNYVSDVFMICLM